MDTTGTLAVRPAARGPGRDALPLAVPRHTAEVGGRQINIESLNDPALCAAAPVTPKAPPNPLRNDVEFLAEFPYLAPPWPEHP